jgi:Fe-S-cluster containining protein
MKRVAALASMPKDKKKDPSFRKFIQRLVARKPKNLDAQFFQAHQDVFAKTDCLTCGNCCRTTSPIWNDTDIQRVSHLFKMKTSAFLDAYLVQDSDGDWVYPKAPCPFLDLEDNKCGIYDHRPKACREYPHTDRKNIMGILALTQQNALICPAVTQILEKIEQIYN